MKKAIVKCIKCSKKMKIPYFAGKNIKVTCPYCMYKFDIVIPKKRFSLVDIFADLANHISSLFDRFKNRFFSNKDAEKEFLALIILITLVLIYFILR